MPLVRKRRAEPSPPASPSQSSSYEDESPRQRRRPASTGPDEGTQGYGGETLVVDGSSTAQMVKKMVRLALACEYARVPIRRADVGVKVLGQHSRQFKPVFEGAQRQLRDVFGMEMVELPLKEKVTISQRRAAQKTEKTAMSSKAYILTSLLPPKYRSDPTILPPPKVPTSHTEAEYVGLYTFIIALISLSGGAIAEAKLNRSLRRTNADQYTPIDRTERLLQRLCKEGYLVRLKDAGGSGEEVVEYMVGPRGKLEVGSEGVKGLVRTVYGSGGGGGGGGENGNGATGGDDNDLEARLQKSLGLEEEDARKEKAKGKGNKSANRRRGDQGSGDGRRGRRRRNEAEEEELGEEEEDSDD
ncbi:MAG: hypothetical protein M1837_004046 [Sclerophora amabilis]|nr:MAG: hypothetical protein M1837_004046 [Sclerophora amabilis]